MTEINKNFPPFLPVPSAAQLAWQRTETNLFVHIGLNTFTGREWGDGSESPALFNPAALDCRQWARLARKAGVGIAILTAKHHDGFCLWPTATTAHSVKNSPWRDGHGDLVREFVDAFRAEGLKVGLYLSPWDRHEPCYGDSERYNAFYCAQLTELLTGYGELHEVWFDGACAEGAGGRKQIYDWERFFALVKRYQPSAVTFGDGGTDVRWVGNERGFANETCWSTVNPLTVRFPGDSGIDRPNDAAAHDAFALHLGSGDEPDPSGASLRVWRPAECDVSIRPGWFYREEEDGQVRTADNLVDLYFRSVGRNGLLLLNVPPTRDGLFHENDAAALLGMRQELDALFARNLAPQGFAGATLPPAPVGTGSGEAYALEMDLAASDDTPVHILCLEEAIEFGQRISAYRIDACLEGAGREQWQEIARGTTIGNKRLHRLDAALRVCRLRLVVEKSFAPPLLSAWRVY